MDTFFSSIQAQAWGGFITAHGRISKQLEDDLRKTSDLSHAEYEVLLRLFRSEGGRLRIQTLAAESVLTHSGTSRLVDRLEAAGHVYRAEADEDRRGAYAVLTDEGRRFFVEAARRHTALVHELFLDHFSEADLALMSKLWTQLPKSGNSESSA